MNRRAFLKCAVLGLCSFKAFLGCGRSRNSETIEQINEMMRHMLGVEDLDVVLFRPTDSGLESRKTAWYGEIVGYVARHYGGPGGVAYERFFARAEKGQVKNPMVSFALEIMRADAITAFYTSPKGWDLAGYQGPPVRSTWVHFGFRKAFFPSCNLPCHAVIDRIGEYGDHGEDRTRF